MTPGELLRACGKATDAGLDRISLAHAPGNGRFLFTGGDTELLNETAYGRVYSVSVARILRHVAKWLADHSSDDSDG